MSKLRTLLDDLRLDGHITSIETQTGCSTVPALDQHARLQIVAHYLTRPTQELITEATYNNEALLAEAVKLGDIPEIGRLFYGMLEREALAYVENADEWRDIEQQVRLAEENRYRPDPSDQAKERELEHE